MGENAPEIPATLQAWSMGLRSWGLPVAILAAIEAAAVTVGEGRSDAMRRQVVLAARECRSGETRRAATLLGLLFADDPAELALRAAIKPLSTEEPSGAETAELAAAAITTAARRTSESTVRAAIRKALLAEVFADSGAIPDAIPKGVSVLVMGLAAYELPPVVLWTATELGRMLARAGHRLLVGTYPGVDHVVARAFVAELQYLGRGAHDRLTQFVFPGVEPSFQAGRLLPVESEDEPMGRADVLITVSGADYVLERARVAPLGFKVVPLRWTGGVSEVIWHERGGSRSRETALLDGKVEHRADLPLLMRRLAGVLALEGSPERRRRFAQYEGALGDLLLSFGVSKGRRSLDEIVGSAPRPEALDTLRRSLPEFADWLAHDYLALVEESARPRALPPAVDAKRGAIPALAELVAAGAREETLENLAVRFRQATEIASSEEVQGLFEAATLLFEHRDQLEAWFIRAVGIAEHEARFRWSIDDGIREVARSYLQPQPLSTSESFIKKLRSELASVEVRRPHWVMPYLTSESAPLRVIGYVLCQTRNAMPSATVFAEVLAAELQASLRSGETRPLWQLLVAAPLDAKEASEIRITLRALGGALTFLETWSKLDPEGQCKARVRGVLVARSTARILREITTLESFARDYDSLQGDDEQHSRPTRLGVLAAVTKYCATLAPSDAEVESWMKGGTEGTRIVALGMMQAMPMPDVSAFSSLLLAIETPKSAFELSVALEHALRWVYRLRTDQMEALGSILRRPGASVEVIVQANPSLGRTSDDLTRLVADLLSAKKRMGQPRIGIFGSGPDDGPLTGFSGLIGEELASSEFSILAGFGTVGLWVADGFGRVDRDPGRLQLIQAKGRRTLRDFGSLITAPPTMRAYREQFVSLIDAAIAIGGRSGTAEECELALRRGIPLIVFPATGGVSAIYLRESVADLKRRGVSAALLDRLAAPRLGDDMASAVIEVLRQIFKSESGAGH